MVMTDPVADLLTRIRNAARAGHEKADAVPIKEVLLVFFLPLLCAAALVIWAVRSWPALARRPGYLALAALAVVVGALVVARIVTYKRINQAEADQIHK